MSELEDRIAAAVAKITRWGQGESSHPFARLREKGYGTEVHFYAADPADDEAERKTAPQPEWGTVTWELPPSYRAFVRLHSSLGVRWGEHTGHDEYVILDPAGITDTSCIVYMPEDVSREPDQYLSTNHLVPFASGRDDECAWCFDVSQRGADGEYPVYWHHQDEPVARYQRDGSWEDPAQNEVPEFASFGAWLIWLADTLDAGQIPELANTPKNRAKRQAKR